MPRERAAVVLSSVTRLADGRRAGFWLPEAAYPWLALADAGWRVVAVSTGDGVPEPSAVDRSDRVQRRFLADEGVRERLAAVRRVTSFVPDDFGVVVYTGGPGALFDLAADDDLAAFTGAVVAAGGIVACCGYGAAGLLPVRLADDRPLLAGRAVTAPAPVEEHELVLDGVLPFVLARELADAGARTQFGAPFQPHVVVDGPVLTGQNPASAPELATAIITATAGPSAAGASGAWSAPR